MNTLKRLIFAVVVAIPLLGFTTGNTPLPGKDTRIQAYRIAHDYEKKKPANKRCDLIWRPDLPEVVNFDQEAPTQLTEAWQKLIFEMNQPGLSGLKYRELLDWIRAFTNFQSGYDNPTGIPRSDFINGRDLTAKPPVFDKTRSVGGAIIHGIRIGPTLYVETLDGSKPPPTWEWLKQRPWLYFKAVIVNADGSISGFPQRKGMPVYLPFVSTGPTRMRTAYKVDNPYTNIGIVTVKINNSVGCKPYAYVTKLKLQR